MSASIELRMKQAQQIIGTNNPETLQYLLPVIKLIKGEYVENTTLEITDAILKFCIKIIDYIVKTSDKNSPEGRVVTECAVMVAQLVVCIHKRIYILFLFIIGIPGTCLLRSDIISSMIDLFDHQKDDIGLCSVLFLYLNRLSGEGMVLPIFLRSAAFA